MKKLPSFFNVWRNSGYSPLQVVGIVLGIASIYQTFVIIYADKRHGIFAQSLIIFSLLLGVFGIILYLYPVLKRYRVLQSVFKTGMEVKGEILEQYFIVRSGYITYQYNCEGQNYRCTDCVFRTKKIKTFVPGQPVVVILNSNDHKVAFVKEVYL